MTMKMTNAGTAPINEGLNHRFVSEVRLLGEIFENQNC